MKKNKSILVLAMLVFSAVLFSCENNNGSIAPKIYSAKILVDMSDSIIFEKFKTELPGVIAKICPNGLDRNEGVQIEVAPIGSTVENKSFTVKFPQNGTLSNNIGNYALQDSNAMKTERLTTDILNGVQRFTSVGDDNSQIFYQVFQEIKNNTVRLYVFSDLLEHSNNISFYDDGFNFDKTLGKLQQKYNLNFQDLTFGGKITIVNPLTKQWQDKIFNARHFYEFFFNKLGIAPQQYEFTGSISNAQLF